MAPLRPLALPKKAIEDGMTNASTIPSNNGGTPAAAEIIQLGLSMRRHHLRSRARQEPVALDEFLMQPERFFKRKYASSLLTRRQRMANSDSISNAEARRLLRELLRQLEKLLQEVVESPRPAIPGRHHESMSAAWTDVQGKFSVAINALNPTDPNAVAPLEEALQERGLTGPQLIFKLSIFPYQLTMPVCTRVR
jgi:hypothetical protein